MQAGRGTTEPGALVVPSSHVVLDEKTDADCAVASHDGWLHLAWTARDTRLNVMVSADGANFTSKTRLRHRSSRLVGGRYKAPMAMEPALAATDRGVFLGWTGNDGQLNVQMLGQPEDTAMTLPERSRNGPALAGRGAELVLAWTGTDGRLNLTDTRRGQFAAPVTLADGSLVRPALAVSDKRQFLLWTAGNKHVNMAEVSTARRGTPMFTRQESDRGPAACWAGNRMVLVWRSRDRHLNVCSVGDEGWGPPTSLPHKSLFNPAVCEHSGHLALGWIGTDRRINVALLRHS